MKYTTFGVVYLTNGGIFEGKSYSIYHFLGGIFASGWYIL